MLSTYVPKSGMDWDNAFGGAHDKYHRACGSFLLHWQL